MERSIVPRSLSERPIWGDWSRTRGWHLAGYDSHAASRKVHRAVKNLMNEVYLDDLADKTHRGIEGQVRAGT